MEGVGGEHSNGDSCARKRSLWESRIILHKQTGQIAKLCEWRIFWKNYAPKSNAFSSNNQKRKRPVDKEG